MPGLVGFAASLGASDHARSVLRGMQELIEHDPSYVKEVLFVEGSCVATRTSLGLVETPRQPSECARFAVWLDGELYGAPGSIRHVGHGGRADPAGLLRQLVFQDPSLRFLSEINGFYSAVIYDRVRQQVMLVSDRYGLKHLYWMRYHNGLAWASEVKAFLALPDISPRVDVGAVDQFLNVGHLLGNRTWFEGIELVPPGSIITYDIRRQRISMRQYWWWDKIASHSERVDEDSAIDVLGELFLAAVGRRCGEDEAVGVSLSGGLDSRAILAAVPQRRQPLEALTFGKQGALDVSIAARAAQMKGVTHHVVELNDTNWLNCRVQGVWYTDGQLDLIHMHSLEAHKKYRDRIPITLNGFAGDVICGGSFLTNKKMCDQLSRAAIAKKMGCPESLLEGIDAYEVLGKSDFYVLQNRIRRFTAEGPRAVSAIKITRKPFYDNDIVEFMYSVPDKWRFRSRLYSRMLLKFFPQYFESLPWQSTGLPIVYPRIVTSAYARMCRVEHLFRSVVPGFGSGDGRRFADYADWLRAEPGASVVRGVLLNPSACIFEFVDARTIRTAVERYLAKQGTSGVVSRLLTLEIWLQQALEGRFRERDGFNVHEQPHVSALH